MRSGFGLLLTILTAASAAADPLAVEVMRDLSADVMQGREAGTEGGKRAGDYIIAKIEDLGLTPDVQTIPVGSGEGRNISAFVPGTGGGEALILLAGHYDHLGMRDGVIRNGADDNASGAGALMAVLDRVSRRPLKHDLLVVFFDDEEGGVDGSNWFVSLKPDLLARPMVMVNLDMIGRPESGRVLVGGSRLTPGLSDIVEGVEAEGVHVVLRGDGIEGDVDWTRSSDHWRFHEAGKPFLFVHTGVHDDYHRATDDVDLIDTDDYGDVVVWVKGLVDGLDNALPKIAR